MTAPSRAASRVLFDAACRSRMTRAELRAHLAAAITSFRAERVASIPTPITVRLFRSALAEAVFRTRRQRWPRAGVRRPRLTLSTPE